jgi:hypothetical protein
LKVVRFPLPKAENPLGTKEFNRRAKFSRFETDASYLFVNCTSRWSDQDALVDQVLRVTTIDMDAYATSRRASALRFASLGIVSQCNRAAGSLPPGGSRKGLAVFGVAGWTGRGENRRQQPTKLKLMSP